MKTEPHQTLMPRDDAASTSNTESIFALSALVDGELSAQESKALLDSLDGDSLPSWHAYHVIGDVLRGQVDPTGMAPASDFLAAVRVGLAHVGSERSALSSVALGGLEPLTAQPLQLAANDAVFRWKLLAGFASLAAVMAVSWGLISGAGGREAEGARLASAAGPQPVSQPAPSAAAPAVEISAGGSQLAVNTGQGVLIRDAQLEAMLAEHRQHGGVSALQMPSGFIRNATYEASGR